MRWNQRFLAALTVMVLLASLTPAEEPRVVAKPAEEKKVEQTKKAETPVIAAGGVQLTNQVYCSTDDDERLMADVVMPKAAKGSLPAVLCFHGGGWVLGN